MLLVSFVLLINTISVVSVVGVVSVVSVQLSGPLLRNSSCSLLLPWDINILLKTNNRRKYISRGSQPVDRDLPVDRIDLHSRSRSIGASRSTSRCVCVCLVIDGTSRSCDVFYIRKVTLGL